jgi:two-component system sensor histidine kinase UhpB
LQESRRAITALRASPLEELGLVGALRHRATVLTERAGLQLHCHFAENLPPLPLLTEQMIYRTADEALLNAEKHAQATTIQLSLQAQPNSVTLEVRDNGVGFVPERVTGNGRFGLIGMQERADLSGAQLTIDAAPGQGTTVRLQVMTL